VSFFIDVAGIGFALDRIYRSGSIADTKAKNRGNGAENILYLKPGYHAGIKSYANKHPEFPHESILNNGSANRNSKAIDRWASHATGRLPVTWKQFWMPSSSAPRRCRKRRRRRKAAPESHLDGATRAGVENRPVRAARVGQIKALR